jgi:hypothetical protein
LSRIGCAYNPGVPKALLSRFPDGTYRVERLDPKGRRRHDDYPSLVAALNADPSLRDAWRGVSAEDRRSGVVTTQVLYVVDED